MWHPQLPQKKKQKPFFFNLFYVFQDRSNSKSNSVIVLRIGENGRNGNGNGRSVE